MKHGLRVRLLGSCLVVATHGLTWPAPAHAQPVTEPVTEPVSEPAPLAEVLEGQAKSDYSTGRLLFASGDYARALLMFQSAYRAASDPRLLWNEAACERSLHHYAKAGSLMSQFLASGSPLVTPDAAVRAHDFLEALVPLTAALEVVSNEASADVYWDDELLGAPALASKARVDLGTHRIVLKKPGFRPYSQTLQVSSSATVRVTAVLLPLPAVPPPAAHDAAPPAAHKGLPTWAWLAGGGLALAGVVTAGYFVFKPAHAPEPVPGTIPNGLRF